MPESEKKTCLVCFMEIPAQAKKCPYCLESQYKWTMRPFHPLLVQIPFIAVFLAMMFWLGTMFKTMNPDGVTFSSAQDKVSVENAFMAFGEDECCKDGKFQSVAVIGTLKNSSPVSWKDLRLEVQFFDKDGKLSDAVQQGQYSYFLPGNGEAKFKVSARREFPKESYASFKVRVMNAKDAVEKY